MIHNTIRVAQAMVALGRNFYDEVLHEPLQEWRALFFEHGIVLVLFS